MEYIYLLQEREFINSKEDIYKVGKTKQINLKRYKQYPKGSALLIQICCKDCDYYEKVILTLFKTKFEQYTNIGYEYFKGNPNTMMNEIIKIIQNNKTEETFDYMSIDHLSIDHESSLIKQFISDYVYSSDSQIIKIKTKELYEHFISWSNSNFTIQKFSRSLKKDFKNGIEGSNGNKILNVQLILNEL